MGNYKILVKNQNQKGEAFSFDKNYITIGRGSNNDLVIQDPFTSKLHLIIKKQDGKYIAEDSGSSNGIKINGTKMKSIELNNNDVIVFGKTKIKFVLTSTTQQPLVAPSVQPPLPINQTPTPIPQQQNIPQAQMPIQPQLYPQPPAPVQSNVDDNVVPLEKMDEDGSDVKQSQLKNKIKSALKLFLFVAFFVFIIGSLLFIKNILYPAKTPKVDVVLKVHEKKIIELPKGIYMESPSNPRYRFVGPEILKLTFINMSNAVMVEALDEGDQTSVEIKTDNGSKVMISFIIRGAIENYEDRYVRMSESEILQKTSELYASGQEYLKSDRIYAALEQFNKALKITKKLAVKPAIYYEIKKDVAKTEKEYNQKLEDLKHQFKNALTVKNRELQKDLLDRIIKLIDDPGNLDYQKAKILRNMLNGG